MILGERVRLRGLDKQDLPICVVWLNDPDVRQGLNRYLPLSIDQEESWYKDISSHPPEEMPMIIEISDKKDSWIPIGCTSFVNYLPRDRSAEFGVFIGEKKYWQQGYGNEVTRLMLKHGFNNLNLHRIYLRVFETNPRAIRCYENVGFIHEGRMRQGVFQDGKYIDILLMSVLYPEWQKGEQL